MVLQDNCDTKLKIHEVMASDQPVKKKQRIDAPDIDDESDKSCEDGLNDIFVENTDFPTRVGESPDSGTVSEDAIDYSAVLRDSNDSNIDDLPSCSNSVPQWNSDKLLIKLKMFQDALVGQCLCNFDENIIFYLLNKRFNIVSLPLTDSVAYLSVVQLMFDIYLKQNSFGIICSKLMHACDILIRNRHNLITEIVELSEHTNKFITFTASKLLATFLIVAKDTVDDTWLHQISENIFLYERINRITVQKINFSLDVIKRIVEWKDREQHPLEDRNTHTSGNVYVQQDNPFRIRTGNGSIKGHKSEICSYNDNFHQAFSVLQTQNSSASTSALNTSEERNFKLQQPKFKLPENRSSDVLEESNSLEEPQLGMEIGNENGCSTVTLTDSESFDTSHIKCLTIRTLEPHWPSLVKIMKLLLLRYINLDNSENCMLTFFSLWENLISVKTNLSIVEVKPFYADLQYFIDLLRKTTLSNLIYSQLLSLFNEVLCYGSTLALQDILPEETCNVAHCIVRFVKDYRFLSELRLQNSSSGFGFLGHDCSVIKDYSLSVLSSTSRNIHLVDQSYGENDNVDIQRSEVDKTTLQKVSLLVLKSVAITVKEMRCDSSDSSIDSTDDNVIQDMRIVERSIRDVLRKLDAFIRNKMEFHPETPFTKMLVHLFSDQDDYLIESLVSTLDITVGIYYKNSVYPDLAQMLDPFISFIEFSKVVSYDSEVLLDYLVSNETCFLLYLLRFLKYARRNWTQFVETCERLNSGNTRCLDQTMGLLIRLRLQITKLVTSSLFPYNINPVLRLLNICESLYEHNGFS